MRDSVGETDSGAQVCRQRRVKGDGDGIIHTSDYVKETLNIKRDELTTWQLLRCASKLTRLAVAIASQKDLGRM